ncbi:MAG: molybdopterin molybdotransferase MoeA [Candidatus Aminicenantes bacterium]|nr:molybdopterin molybdotransferase MoeA [Candidatus Aminicenantes bacterium]
MITYEKASQLVLKEARPLGRETVPIEKALGRVVAKEIKAFLSLPPFTNSAVDGYALRSQDTDEIELSGKEICLKLLAEQRAGDYFAGQIRKGTALKVMTGSPIPLGADAVVPKEEVDERGNFIFLKRKVRKGENIRLAGEDVKKGEKIIERGIVLRPVHLGLFAACGIKEISVYCQPKVYALITGDELCPPGKPLKPGMIYDANSSLIRALVESSGAKLLAVKRVKDKLANLSANLERALNQADIVLTSGGVSVGDYDLVKEAAEKMGAQRIFWQVAQKPAKPLAFYKFYLNNRKSFLFGLPGNPGAVFISFEEYVRPFIKKIMGQKDYLPKEIEATLTHSFRKKRGRLNFLRVKLQLARGEWLATSVGAQESGILSTLGETQGFALIPAETEFLETGTKIKVHLLE